MEGFLIALCCGALICILSLAFIVGILLAVGTFSYLGELSRAYRSSAEIAEKHGFQVYFYKSLLSLLANPFNPPKEYVVRTVTGTQDLKVDLTRVITVLSDVIEWATGVRFYPLWGKYLTRFVKLGDKLTFLFIGKTFDITSWKKFLFFLVPINLFLRINSFITSCISLHPSLVGQDEIPAHRYTIEALFVKPDGTLAVRSNSCQRIEDEIVGMAKNLLDRFERGKVVGYLVVLFFDDGELRMTYQLLATDPRNSFQFSDTLKAFNSALPEAVSVPLEIDDLIWRELRS